MCFTEPCFCDQKTKFEDQNKNGAKENKNQRKKVEFPVSSSGVLHVSRGNWRKKSVTWQRRQWNRNR